MNYSGMCIYDCYEKIPVDFVDEKQAYKELEEYDQERYCLAKLYTKPYTMQDGFEDVEEFYEIVD